MVSLEAAAHRLVLRCLNSISLAVAGQPRFFPGPAGQLAAALCGASLRLALPATPSPKAILTAELRTMKARLN